MIARSWVISLLLHYALVNASTLYGYYSEGTTSALVIIDSASGAHKTVCDLDQLPPLLGASSSVKYTSALGDGNGLLFFYTISEIGNISLVTLDPQTCKSNTTIITGLNTGQNDVRDIKYDNINDKLYMVFPNPFCMHGSLDQMNADTGAVISHLTNVGDPEGLAQTAAVSGKSGSYYFVGVPIGVPDAVTYQLTKVQLSTGNTSNVNLNNNNLDVGDMWGSNYTLNVLTTAAGDTIVGAITPSSTTVKECSPSGFYNINTVTGNVTCAYGPISYSVESVADMDPSTSYYYQLFYDEHDTYYLYTFDTVKNQVISSPQCAICAQLQVLAVLP